MKHLTNIYDPKRLDAKSMIMTLRGQTQAEAWRLQQQWLSGKMIGSPKATDQYSIQELAAIGMVGVYVFPTLTSAEPDAATAVAKSADELATEVLGGNHALGGSKVTEYDVTPEAIEKRKAKAKVDVQEAAKALSALGWLLLIVGCVGAVLLYVILTL